MTIRGGYLDIFWFSLFHEIGHLILHQKKMFLEDGYSDPTSKKQEDEADEFAKDLLISKKDFEVFREQNIFDKNAILEFAKHLKIKPSIIVGRLMHEKIIAYNNFQLTKLRDKYAWA